MVALAAGYGVRWGGWVKGKGEGLMALESQRVMERIDQVKEDLRIMAEADNITDEEPADQVGRVQSAAEALLDHADARAARMATGRCTNTRTGLAPLRARHSTSC